MNVSFHLFAVESICIASVLPNSCSPGQRDKSTVMACYTCIYSSGHFNNCNWAGLQCGVRQHMSVTIVFVALLSESWRIALAQCQAAHMPRSLHKEKSQIYKHSFRLFAASLSWEDEVSQHCRFREGALLWSYITNLLLWPRGRPHLSLLTFHLPLF